jgi:hypothetical protein
MVVSMVVRVVRRKGDDGRGVDPKGLGNGPESDGAVISRTFWRDVVVVSGRVKAGGGVVGLECFEWTSPGRRRIICRTSRTRGAQGRVVVPASDW